MKGGTIMTHARATLSLSAALLGAAAGVPSAWAYPPGVGILANNRSTCRTP
jgi:hypothetical protein